MKLWLKVNVSKAELIRTEEKINIEAINDESTKDLHSKRLAEKIINNEIYETDDVNESWKKLKENIKNAANEALGVRKITRSSKQIKTTPWFSREIKEKCKEKQKAYLKYLSEKTQTSYENYKGIRNDVKDLVRKHKLEHWEMFTKRMEYDFYGLKKQMWRMILGQRAEVRELVGTNQISLENWVDYFAKLYKSSNESMQFVFPTEVDAEVVHTEVTQEEVEEVVNKLKNRKSPGIYKINSELLKYGGLELIQQLTQLIQKIFYSQIIPEEWRMNVVIPLFKKGDKTDPQNYRGINLLNTVLKIVTRIIHNKLSRLLTLEDEQQGFRSGRSCVDAVFVIRQVMEKAIEYNRPAFMCFIDLEKAYDCIQLTDVIQILHNRQIPLDIIKLIGNIYHDNKVRLKIKGKLSEEISMEKGIRQGDSLSPLLFNLVMDEIIKKVKLKRGYQMGNKEIKIVCYADDVVLIAENEDDLQRLLYQFTMTAKEFNMKISHQKTKAMTVYKFPIRCKLVVENNIIEQVSTIKYLGIQLTSYGSLQEEISSQVSKANRISGCLREIIWKNKYLRTDAKVRIYKSIIRPILAYTAETRPITAAARRFLETSEMKVLRAISNKSLRDKIRSEQIRKDLGIEQISVWIDNRKKEWNEHIDRMQDRRIVKIARDKIPKGKRSLGRPKKRWKDDLEAAH